MLLQSIRIVNRTWNIILWVLINLLADVWLWFMFEGHTSGQFISLAFVFTVTAFLLFLGSRLIAVLSIAVAVFLLFMFVSSVQSSCTGEGCMAVPIFYFFGAIILIPHAFIAILTSRTSEKRPQTKMPK